MLRIKHGIKLMIELWNYAIGNRIWWLALLIPIVAIGLALIGTAETVVPYTVYTLF